MNYDYDYNSEYGDGDIPDIDKPRNRKSDAFDVTDNSWEEKPKKKKSKDK